MSVFADNLRSRTEALGLTQAELARRLAIDPRRLGHYMTGLREPDLATLGRIAKVLDTSCDALLGLTAWELPADRGDALRSQITAACASLSDDQLQTVLLLATAIHEQEVPARRGGNAPSRKTSARGSRRARRE